MNRFVVIVVAAVLAVLAPGVARAQSEAAVEDVLIDEVPAPYTLSPESEGITGPFDAEKARQLGLPAEELARGKEVLDGTYLRLWVHPDQQAAIVALVFRGTSEAVAASMLQGAIDADELKNAETFTVAEVPDAYGFTTEVPQNGGQPLASHTILFRRGEHLFNVATVGPPNMDSQIARDLAVQQFESAPEGGTGTTADDPAYFLGFAIGLAAVIGFAVLLLAGLGLLIFFLIRRSRRKHAAATGVPLNQWQPPADTPTPPPADPAP